MMRAILPGVMMALAITPSAAAGQAHHHEAAPPPVPPPDKAPEPPGDHAADAYYDPEDMAAARALLRRENGGMGASMILLDRLELVTGQGRDGFRWAGEAWWGGDIDRLVLKSQGEGAFSGGMEQAEVQALYARALDPWFNLQLGVRHDVRPEPQRSYAAIGVQGLAPFWFEVEGALFLSDRGDLSARVEASHDIRLTQRLLLTPRAELNFAARKVEALNQGAGLTSAEFGLRLHYAVAPRFAPYVGLHWEYLSGASARLARAEGDRSHRMALVTGVRIWF